MTGTYRADELVPGCEEPDTVSPPAADSCGDNFLQSWSWPGRKSSTYKRMRREGSRPISHLTVSIKAKK